MSKYLEWAKQKQKDEALRELLSYCEQNSILEEGPFSSASARKAYGDVTAKLREILDGEQ